MKLLALDTSTEACSVALMVDDQIVALDEVCPQQHSKRVLPMVQQLLSEAELSLQQLDGLVFGKGPGSFTGVRIGVGVAQGLAFGADLPVHGVSTLAAMAQAAFRTMQAKQVIAAIDARMAEIYLGQYQLDGAGLMQLQGIEQAIKPTALTPLTDAADYVAVGTGWQTYGDELQHWQTARSSSILYPSAQDMLVLAKPAWQQACFVAAELAEPSYVRDEVSWKKLPGRG
ncbi:tRNA (adenosine(37)-N6)-threonylcarbamoyltransferase complex dimerization subunit type 1 TsaB [Alkalimonas collagenimarina]|uniref:tRNA threonylcarbamoyladenosine biosynthesis protein TsaB n=1 Tax=Alkalimonas collagenimarina TaxID=400390 RepID=A0ABT9GUD4_9GAMM|nr:tRNA (adenosine(37)-N6)-threonylcarbamoyltransferase complex dimerization subunit type 1 TsaB [Alkalimonas collagenimarina]MDP4534659.1 tRNA (adenosine(37)-N6)-threonylcarbamoyltransferase complex dimerization subunit type 1 TsaB [Alkalimonas collagenimarina]